MLQYDELERYDFDKRNIISAQADIEAIKILKSKLADLTFNGPSDTYTNEEAASISAISDNAISFDFMLTL